MPKFGKRSYERLEGVHPLLILVAEETCDVFDITVLKDGGRRLLSRQQELVDSGASKTLLSDHLPQEDGYSHALDIAPYPVDWNDSNRFFFMAGLMFAFAKKRGIWLKWGHDWDGDMDFKDQTFNDSPHFGIILEGETDGG